MWTWCLLCPFRQLTACRQYSAYRPGDSHILQDHMLRILDGNFDAIRESSHSLTHTLSSFYMSPCLSLVWTCDVIFFFQFTLCTSQMCVSVAATKIRSQLAYHFLSFHTATRIFRVHFIVCVFCMPFAHCAEYHRASSRIENWSKHRIGIDKKNGKIAEKKNKQFRETTRNTC